MAPVMAAIALAESGGNPRALNNNPATGDYSVGLWQINYFGNLAPSRTQRYGSPQQVTDPIANAKAAVDLAQNGFGLGNWSTFKNGAYRQYLNSNVQPSGTAVTTSAPLTPSQNPKNLSPSQIKAVLNAVLNGKLTPAEAKAKYGIDVQSDPYGGVPGGGLVQDAGQAIGNTLGTVGKDVAFGLTIAGGGLLMIVGFILIGVDIGISGKRGNNIPPVRAARTVRNQFGSSSTRNSNRTLAREYDTGRAQGERTQARRAGRRSVADASRASTVSGESRYEKNRRIQKEKESYGEVPF